MIFLAIGAFSLHASSEGEASSALSSSPQSGPRASTASRVCPAPKQLTEPWPRPSLWSVRCLLASVWLTATHFCFFLVLVPFLSVWFLPYSQPFPNPKPLSLLRTTTTLKLHPFSADSSDLFPNY